ncbi:MAG: hypothetical protein RL681_346 [Candidatus Parcubacteria bacterium]|jgi:hypothetical protein
MIVYILEGSVEKSFAMVIWIHALYNLIPIGANECYFVCPK